MFKYGFGFGLVWLVWIGKDNLLTTAKFMHCRGRKNAFLIFNPEILRWTSEIKMTKVKID